MGTGNGSKFRWYLELLGCREWRDQSTKKFNFYTLLASYIVDPGSTTQRLRNSLELATPHLIPKATKERFGIIELSSPFSPPTIA
uniref:Uncharacterized protein n=1 Tax=Cucumis melo TaxID=3656 RepID=A0A9I9ELD1_CUCME